MDCFFMGMVTDADGHSTLAKPIPSDQGRNIRTAGSVKQENALYKDALGDTKTWLHEKSTHYLGKASSLNGDAWSEYMIATLAQAKPRRNILGSISDALTDRNGFNVAFYIPPRPNETSVDTTNDSRFAEDIMGEETEHLTKLTVKTYIHRHLDDHHAVMRFLGNCWMLPQVIYDTSTVEPIWSTCIEELGQALTEPSVQKWFEATCSKPEGMHIPYSVLNIVEQLHVQLSTSQKERTVLACMNENVATVNTDIYISALSLVRKFVDKVISASKGGDHLAPCTLWMTSAKKKACDSISVLRETDRLRKLAASIRPATGPNSHRNRNADTLNAPPAKKAKSLVGDIKFHNKDDPKATMRELPMPTLSVGKQPCPPFYRYGSFCKRRNCTFSHDPIDKLPTSSKLEWFAHIKAQPHLHFNKDSVTCFDVNGAVVPPT